MILIIAEKPSLARNIASAIGDLRRRDGYLEGEGYIVTWAFGHLFSLCDIEAYSPLPAGTTGWTMENLPCFPETFRFELRKGDDKKTVDSGVQKQFGIITSLCAREDVDTIVNAGDADREGEIIVRLCITHAAVNGKALKRLWLPDQTPQTVRTALAEMKDESEYDNLADEGFARTYIDWLYGVNLTRYATLRTGTLLRVGRVIVPIVKAIYERDMAIRNFIPGKYLSLASKEETKGEVVELNSKKKFDIEDASKAEALCAKYNQAGAVVTAVKNQKSTLPPGKLYSLSKLQNVLGKKYKMSMKDSLDIIQKLYEEGYLTYPRTNSEYLATAEKGKIKTILENCKKLGYPVEFKDSKSIFDDSKIESHSALTPTYKIPAKGALSQRENQVYSTVFRRFIAVFCAEPCKISKTEITIAVGDLETFTLKGNVILEPGWTKYDDRTQKDKVLPPLEKGDQVVIDFKPVEKETSPPKHYTIETLNNYLKNPFREEKAAAKEAAENADDTEQEDDTEDYRAMFEGLELGTEATRTGIIDNARHSGYIELKKDTYFILPGGEFLVESLENLGVVMDKFKTAELGKALKSVFRGKITVRDSVDLAKEKISAAMEAGEGSHDIGYFGDILGACPLCGNEIRRMRSFYGCAGYKDGCKFTVQTYICGRAISADNLRKLLTEGKTDPIEGFVSKKTGNTFTARLVLDEEKKAVFAFDDRKPKKKAPPPAPLCPKCKSPIVKGKTAYGCSAWKSGCDFRLPFEQNGKFLTDEEAARLLNGEVTQ